MFWVLVTLMLISLLGLKNCVLPHDVSGVFRLATQAAVVPTELGNSRFNVTLGCWHVRSDTRGSHSFHVSAEANFGPGERWHEVVSAIKRTHSSNPGVHYILVTRMLSMVRLAPSSLVDVPHDLWFCPEVLYGTPIHIGNLYEGPKFTLSIDNWIPPFAWKCSFAQEKQAIVYIVQRSQTMDLTGQNTGCEEFRDQGSADGILYDSIPTATVDYLR